MDFNESLRIQYVLMSTIEEWTEIAGVDAIPPNSMRCFELASRRILLAFSDGQYYASDEMCTHEDASLCTGSLKGHFVKCPLHGSRFDLISGDALDDPANEPLRTYAVKVENDLIFVNLTQESG